MEEDKQKSADELKKSIQARIAEAMENQAIAFLQQYKSRGQMRRHKAAQTRQATRKALRAVRRMRWSKAKLAAVHRERTPIRKRDQRKSEERRRLRVQRRARAA